MAIQFFENTVSKSNTWLKEHNTELGEVGLEFIGLAEPVVFVAMSCAAIGKTALFEFPGMLGLFEAVGAYLMIHEWIQAYRTWHQYKNQTIVAAAGEEWEESVTMGQASLRILRAASISLLILAALVFSFLQRGLKNGYVFSFPNITPLYLLGSAFFTVTVGIELFWELGAFMYHLVKFCRTSDHTQRNYYGNAMGHNAIRLFVLGALFVLLLCQPVGWLALGWLGFAVGMIVTMDALWQRWQTMHHVMYPHEKQSEKGCGNYIWDFFHRRSLSSPPPVISASPPAAPVFS